MLYNEIFFMFRTYCVTIFHHCTKKNILANMFTNLVHCTLLIFVKYFHGFISVFRNNCYSDPHNGIVKQFVDNELCT